jgi:hypothetical protein
MKLDREHVGERGEGIVAGFADVGGAIVHERLAISGDGDAEVIDKFLFVRHDREIDVREDDLIVFNELFKGIWEVVRGKEIFGDFSVLGIEVESIESAFILGVGINEEDLEIIADLLGEALHVVLPEGVLDFWDSLAIRSKEGDLIFEGADLIAWKLKVKDGETMVDLGLLILDHFAVFG